MSDFTPTTGDVRNYYAGWVDERSSDSVEEAYAEFDRWLAEFERQVREQIARDIERLAAQLDARSITYQTYTERAVLQVKREGVDEAARIARGAAS